MGLKLRLDKALTDLDDYPIRTDKSPDELKAELDKIEKANKDLPDDKKDKTKQDTKRNMVVRDVCDTALLGVERNPETGQPIDLTDVEKLARYNLAVSIRRGEDIKKEDIEKLRKLIRSAYRMPLVVGQMDIILSGGHTEHGHLEPEGEKNDGSKA